MDDNDAANVIRRIDELLDDGGLDEATTDELVELLTPQDSEPWPDLEAVLHLAEHPTVADDLKQHAIPGRLEQAIGEALEAVFPLLGLRPYGPTFKLVDIARRTFDGESEKFELVVDRLEEVDEEERRALIERYLQTEPAPMFVNRMRRLYPELVPEAGEVEAAGESTREELQGLVEELERARSQGASMLEAVAEIVGQLDEPAREIASLGLASDGAAEQVVGAALMVRFDLEDLLATAFHCVREGRAGAPWVAVLVGNMSPERARSAFSTFIGEVTWQNPELPDAELTTERVRAILSARSVLPEIGSPMEPLGSDDVPDHVDDPDLRAIPDLVAEAWSDWQRVRSDG